MMKYLKAEAEIIEFDNSDVVTNSLCADNASVEQNCVDASTSHQDQAAVYCTNWTSAWWWVVTFICVFTGWRWSAQSTSTMAVDEFAAENSVGDRDF